MQKPIKELAAVPPYLLDTPRSCALPVPGAVRNLIWLRLSFKAQEVLSFVCPRFVIA